MAFVFRVSEDLSRRKSVFLFSPQMWLYLYFLPTFHLLLCLQFIQAWLAAFYSPVSRGGCICRQGTLGDFSRHCIAFQWTTNKPIIYNCTATQSVTAKLQNNPLKIGRGHTSHHLQLQQNYTVGRNNPSLELIFFITH